MSLGCNLVQSQTPSRCQRWCQQDFEAARPLPRRNASTHDLVQTKAWSNHIAISPISKKHSMARKQTTSYHAGHQTEGCTSFWGRVAQSYRRTIYPWPYWLELESLSNLALQVCFQSRFKSADANMSFRNADIYIYIYVYTRKLVGLWNKSNYIRQSKVNSWLMTPIPMLK